MAGMPASSTNICNNSRLWTRGVPGHGHLVQKVRHRLQQAEGDYDIGSCQEYLQKTRYELFRGILRLRGNAATHE